MKAIVQKNDIGENQSLKIMRTSLNWGALLSFNEIFALLFQKWKTCQIQ